MPDAYYSQGALKEGRAKTMPNTRNRVTPNAPRPLARARREDESRHSYTTRERGAKSLENIVEPARRDMTNCDSAVPLTLLWNQNAASLKDSTSISIDWGPFGLGNLSAVGMDQKTGRDSFE